MSGWKKIGPPDARYLEALEVGDDAGLMIRLAAEPKHHQAHYAPNAELALEGDDWIIRGRAGSPFAGDLADISNAIHQLISALGGGQGSDDGLLSELIQSANKLRGAVESVAREIDALTAATRSAAR